jgi:hypothetical protein
MNGFREQRPLAVRNCTQVFFNSTSGLNDRVDLIRPSSGTGLICELREGADVGRQGIEREVLALLDVKIHFLPRDG